MCVWLCLSVRVYTACPRVCVCQTYDYKLCVIRFGTHLPEVVLAPPTLYLLFLAREHKNLLARESKPHLALAAQNVFDRPNGAFTGEVSVSQLRSAGVDWVILGHSERRTVLNESNEVGASYER